MGVYTPNVTIQGTSGGSAVTVKNARSATFDSEFTVTDNGGRNARIDITTGGGGTIGGTIANDQVAFGSGTDAIEGSSDLTWNGSKLMVEGTTAREIELKDTGGTSVSTVLLQVGSQGENAVLEMGSETGAFIDMKDPYSTDYNLRISHDSGLSKILSNSALEISNVGGGADDDISVISKRNLYLRTDGTNIIEDEVANADLGPVVELRKLHEGASYSGSIRWMGKNDNGDFRTHLNIFSQFTDRTAGNEDTKTYFRVWGDGGNRDAIQIRADSALPKIGINCHPGYTLDVKTNSEAAGIRINTNESEADYMLLGARDLEMYNVSAAGADSKFRIRNEESGGIIISSPSGDWVYWRDSLAKNVMIIAPSSGTLGSADYLWTTYRNRPYYRTKYTADASIPNSECWGSVIYMAKASGGTLTLPTAYAGSNLTVVNYDATGTQLLAVSGTDTLNGSTSDYDIGAPFTAVELVAHEEGKWCASKRMPS